MVPLLFGYDTKQSRSDLPPPDNWIWIVDWESYVKGISTKDAIGFDTIPYLYYRAAAHDPAL